MNPFAERDLRVDDDAFELLKQPCNSVILGVTGPVKKGQEMLVRYPNPAPVEGSDGYVIGWQPPVESCHQTGEGRGHGGVGGEGG